MNCQLIGKSAAYASSHNTLDNHFQLQRLLNTLSGHKTSTTYTSLSNFCSHQMKSLVKVYRPSGSSPAGINTMSMLCPPPKSKLTSQSLILIGVDGHRIGAGNPIFNTVVQVTVHSHLTCIGFEAEWYRHCKWWLSECRCRLNRPLSNRNYRSPSCRQGLSIQQGFHSTGHLLALKGLSSR